MIGPVSDLITSDVIDVLSSARSHGGTLRTLGFLINYGLSAQTAQTLVRGGLSTITELDTAECAWSATAEPRSFSASLHIPGLGAVQGRNLREALHRWRADDPAAATPVTDAGRLVLTIRAQIAAGDFGHGQMLPTWATLARRHGVRPADAQVACEVLELAGWCAWRDIPNDATYRMRRQHAVILVPGRPYDVVWPSPAMARASRRASKSVQFLRHNPGSWRSNDSSHTLRRLAPISEAHFDDPSETVTITALSDTKS